MRLPPLGVCLPCRVVRVLDGDTVEVTAVLGPKWKIRLADCWAHETRRGSAALRAKGQAAKAYAQETLDDARQCWLWIPAPESVEAAAAAGGGGVNPLELATFDRLVGYLFVSHDDTLNELLVRSGHAFATKSELEADAAKVEGRDSPGKAAA